MRFHDFEIRAWQTSECQAQVMVHNSPAGHMRKPLSVPVDEERLKDGCYLFEQPRWYQGVQGFLGRLLVELGQALARIILPAEIYSRLTESLQRIPTEDGLRLRLCLDESLVDRPWEYLVRPDAPAGATVTGFLCLDPRVSLVREPAATDLTLSRSGGAQRLVFAGMEWVGGSQHWRVEEEHRELCRSLESAKKLVSTEMITAAGEGIAVALMKPAYIFHYAGHTYVRNGHGCLVREVHGRQPLDPVYVTESDAELEAYTPMFSEELGQLLLRARTRLALFSAPNSGRWAFVEPMVRAGIPAVIGTQGQTSTKALAAFCEKLYYSLAQGLSLDEAVTWARLHVLEQATASENPSFEWGAFMVYMPSKEAVLFPRPEIPAVRADQAKARQERQQTIVAVQRDINQTALRKGIVNSMTPEDLDVLCADIEQDLRNARIDLKVRLEEVGGDQLANKALNLIRYLDSRSYLDYLVSRLRSDWPKVFGDYQSLR